MDIILKHPFTTAAGVKVDKLVVKRPTRGDLKKAYRRHPNDEFEQENHIYCVITGMVEEDLDLLDAEDARALTECFRKMLGESKVAASA